jgi:hypothetical protein
MCDLPKTKTFDKGYLNVDYQDGAISDDDWAELPDDGGTRFDVVSDEQIDSRRWVAVHQLIFREKGMPEGYAWCCYYDVGLTEYQDVTPWEGETQVECQLVQQVEKIIRCWVPVQ